MKTEINRDLLRDLKAGALAAAPGETIHDVTLKGFCIRVRPAGRFFYVVKRVGTRVAFLKIGDCELMTVSAAREKAREALARITLGEAPAQVQRSTEKTLLDYLNGSYADYLATRQKTPALTVSSMKSAFADLLDVALEKITPVMIDRWQGSFIKGGRSPARANRVMNDLRAFFAYVVGRGILDKNPLTIVKRIKQDDDGGIVRYLTPEEETRLRTALDARETTKRESRARGNAWRIERSQDARADLRIVSFVDYLKPAVLLSLNTGMRQGEVFKLTWASVNLDKGMVTVTASTAKSQKARHVPLNAEAKAALKAWHKQGTGEGYVFPGREGGQLVEIKTAWAKLLRDAGIENFRWHDMRHHFASRLVMAGVDLNTVRELLGHSDIKMTLRYAHLAPEHKHAAVELLCTAPIKAKTKSNTAAGRSPAKAGRKSADTPKRP